MKINLHIKEMHVFRRFEELFLLQIYAHFQLVIIQINHICFVGSFGAISCLVLIDVFGGVAATWFLLCTWLCRVGGSHIQGDHFCFIMILQMIGIEFMMEEHVVCSPNVFLLKERC